MKKITVVGGVILVTRSITEKSGIKEKEVIN
jgi:hypothetical protein